MAKDASQRYPTPSAVADALAPWTQTPIPPPPDKEMPQLSLAAMGASTGENTLSGGPKTPPSGVLSPSPRKSWQVSGTPTPAPPSPVPKSNPPAPTMAPRDLRKTNPPPPGPLAIQPPTPAVVPAPSPPAAPAAAARAPVVAPTSPQTRPVSTPGVQTQRSIAPVPAPAVPASRPSAVNGSPQPAAPVMPAPPPESGASEDAPSWARSSRRMAPPCARRLDPSRRT